MKHLLSIIALALILCSCQNGGLPPSLLTSAQVAKDVKFVGQQVVDQVSAKTKTVLHAGAVQLLALSSATVTSATLTSILSSLKLNIPAQDQFIVGVVIDTITGGLNWALNKFGEKNPKVIEYTSAVGQAILDAGF